MHKIHNPLDGPPIKAWHEISPNSKLKRKRVRIIEAELATLGTNTGNFYMVKVLELRVGRRLVCIPLPFVTKRHSNNW